MPRGEESKDGSDDFLKKRREEMTSVWYKQTAGNKRA